MDKACAKNCGKKVQTGIGITKSRKKGKGKDKKLKRGHKGTMHEGLQWKPFGM